MSRFLNTGKRSRIVAAGVLTVGLLGGAGSPRPPTVSPAARTASRAPTRTARSHPREDLVYEVLGRRERRRLARPRQLWRQEARSASATGQYQINWTRSERLCGRFATIGLPGSSGTEAPGFITTVGRVGKPKSTYVATSDVTGATPTGRSRCTSPADPDHASAVTPPARRAASAAVRRAGASCGSDRRSADAATAARSASRAPASGSVASMPDRAPDSRSGARARRCRPAVARRGRGRRVRAGAHRDGHAVRRRRRRSTSTPRARLAAHLVDQGCDGLVVSGTTGEAPTTTEPSRTTCCGPCSRPSATGPASSPASAPTTPAHAGPRRQAAAKPVRTACWSSRRTTTSRRRTGCSPTSRAVADATDLPVMLYDIPGRTGAAIRHETLLAPRRAPPDPGRQGRQGRPVRGLARAWPRPASPTTPATTRSTCRGSPWARPGVVSVVAHVAPPRGTPRWSRPSTPATWPRARKLHVELLPAVRRRHDPHPGRADAKAGARAAGRARQPAVRVRLPGDARRWRADATT